MSPLLLAQLEFAQPEWLFALALLLVVAGVADFANSDFSRGQRFVSMLVRCAILALLILAVADPSWRGLTSQKYVAFVADESSSFNEADQSSSAYFAETVLATRGRHRVGWLRFAGESAPLQEIISETPPPALATLAGDEATDVEAALLAAQGSIPAMHVPHLVLLTDGQETRGDLRRAALGNTPITVGTPTVVHEGEVAVVDLEAPVHAAAGSKFTAKAVVFAQQATEATLTFLRDEQQVSEETVQLQEGLNRISHRFYFLADAKQHILTAKIEAADDSLAENNVYRQGVLAAPPKRVLLLAEDATNSTPLVTAIQAAGYNVKQSNNLAEELTYAKLEFIDLVVLNNLPASQITKDLAEILQDYLVGGGGVIVTGGKSTFEYGNFADSQLEALLPIEAMKPIEIPPKTLALVLVVDRSESMLKEDRLGLAKQAAQSTVRYLSENDQLGVLAFGTEAEWIAPLKSVTDKTQIVEQIDALAAAGMTNMYPALERAYHALAQTDADRRHLIVLTDGVSTPGDFSQLARRFHQAEIGVSTVSVSRNADQTILRHFARESAGQHFHSDDPRGLVDIFAKATAAAADQGSVHYDVIPYGELKGLETGDAPQLANFVSTSPKADARIVLLAGEGDPLVAWRTIDEGIILAIPSDPSQETEWTDWNGFTAFWNSLTRHVERKQRPRRFFVSVIAGDWADTFTLDALTRSGEHLDRAFGLIGTPSVLSPLRLVSLNQIGPGRYEGHYPLTEPTEVELVVGPPDDYEETYRERRLLVPNYASEYKIQTPEQKQRLEAVALATGGGFRPDLPFADDGRRVIRVTPLWNWFVLAALLLFILDVALRRIRLRVAPTTGAMAH